MSAWLFIRLACAAAATLVLLPLNWSAAAILAVIALITGGFDKSLGHEISDRMIGPVTDNAISWGILIFGPYLGMAIGLFLNGSSGWAVISLITLLASAAFQAFAEASPKRFSAELKAKIGAVSAVLTVVLLLVLALIN
jgi:hypothetical protein